MSQDKLRELRRRLGVSGKGTEDQGAGDGEPAAPQGGPAKGPAMPSKSDAEDRASTTRRL